MQVLQESFSGELEEKKTYHRRETIPNTANSKGRGDERVAKLLDSPDMPEKECVYIINEGGITDSEG